MLYSLHELQRAWLGGVADLARTMRDAALPVVRANAALLERLGKDYPRQPFAIPGTRERVVLEQPFVRLVRFEPLEAAARDDLPRVLVCAPLSGHHATLLRDTIATLLPAHDVYVTDWRDARDVPASAGPFHLADYVAYVEAMIGALGPDVHVVAVCQPTVPVLAAVARLAAAGAPTPRTLTLMGGPIDARVSPTAVNRFATSRPIEWFARHAIHTVPAPHAGAGRAVYPGFLQLGAFVSMNPARHAAAYRDYWFDQLRGDAAAVAAHERFYDEYNAVLDMDAAYYLDTVRTVFQEFALARGTWTIGGERVRPDAITRTALLTIEGATDDISGAGQTAAAHALCSGIVAAHKSHFVAADCGHYGIFSGHRWREVVYPRVAAHIAAA